MRMKTIMMLIAITLPLLALSGCKLEQSAQAQGEAVQEQNAQNAFQRVPVPKINHYINREAVAEYVKRLNDPSKTFYVYLLSLSGDVIGYYVTRTHPISVCMLMTPSEREINVTGSPHPMGPAPTLDGLYGSGGNMCDHYYAFTADTDTLVEFSNDFFIADAPLQVEADVLSK